MKITRALVAGAAGTAVMTLILAIGWTAFHAVALGENMIVDNAPLQNSAIRIGLAAYVVIGIVSGVVYGLIFEFVTRRAGWLIGGIVGALHSTGTLIALTLIFWFGGDVISEAAPFAVEMFHHPALVAIVIAAQVAYGATIGAVYGKTVHKAVTPVVVQWYEVTS